MAGIDAIVATIVEEAKASAQDIITEAESSAKETLETARANAERTLDEERARLDQEGELARQRTTSKCDMLIGRRQLARKQELVSEVVKRAQEQLLNQDTSAYFDMLLEVAKKNLAPEAGEMLLSQADLDRMPQDFSQRVSELASSCGGSLSLGLADMPLNGGFILRYGMIDISCTLDALFDERAEQIRDRVAALLFQE